MCACAFAGDVLCALLRMNDDVMSGDCDDAAVCMCTSVHVSPPADVSTCSRANLPRFKDDEANGWTASPR